MIDKVSDSGKEVFILGDLNIDYFSPNCHLRKKLHSVTNACNLGQVVNQPTSVFINKAGGRSSTCIDHIFTNAAEHCSKSKSLPTGCSDHNLVSITRQIKIPRAGNKVVFRRSFKSFNPDQFLPP